MVEWLTSWRPNQEQAAAVVRWLLGLAGAWAIQKGYIDASQLTMIVGIGVAFVPLVWSFVIKTQSAQVKQTATLADITVTVGPDATETVKELAHNPKFPNIIPSR